MSPTSYQAAPPRNLIVTTVWGSVKPLRRKDVEKGPLQPILVGMEVQRAMFAAKRQTWGGEWRIQRLFVREVSEGRITDVSAVKAPRICPFE